MPKLVDPKQRRAELAEAVWTVIRRDGLQRASVRDYAEQVALIPHLVHLLPPSSTGPVFMGGSVLCTASRLRSPLRCPRSPDDDPSPAPPP